MARFIQFNQVRLVIAVISLSLFISACTSSATSRYWGKTEPPAENVLRYISGSEPESLDPQVPTGQPEARVLMALYDGLVEYHPKTMDPIPALAESWKISPDGTEFIFNIRKGAKFSNGAPITARDFVYTFRRGLSPELAAQNAYLAYEIKYAQAYNGGESFVRDANGQFLLKKDFEEKPAAPPAENAAVNTTAKTETQAADATAAAAAAGSETGKTAASSAASNFGPATEFQRFINSPERLSVPSDEKSRAKLFEKNPKLKQAVEGKELVPIRGEDLGVEAIDDHTFRMKLKLPAPYFLALLGHQFFRVVHQPTVEKFGKYWTRPENIVTSGAFKLKVHRPYDEMIVEKEPTYWDAANVRLDRIEFYPLEESTTMMNLYKAGRVDAIYNHTVPAAWNEEIRKYKDEYMNHPEVAIEYYTFNVNKGPTANLKVRQAFALAVDRNALAKFRRTTKPLTDFTPEGIFPKYEEARKKVYAELLQANNISQEEWQKRVFNPAKACQLMREAGYQVQDREGGRCVVTNFPLEEMAVTYNTAESNKAVAEFLQAQWKQNLGLTIPLKNMEWKTFLPVRKAVDYQGMARAGWVGDYMDPNTFLKLFYGPNNDSSTGYYDPKFDQMMNQANSETDPQKRLELLARAEFYMMQSQPVAPWQTQATNWMKKPYVKGLYPNPGTLHAWKFVYLERDPNKWDRNVDNIMSETNPETEELINKLMATQLQFERQQQQTNQTGAE
jgi:oligopeptide transport system substrate-binding protein